MKMKKVDAIVRRKATGTEDAMNRKAQRLMRNVENAIAFAEDKVDECEECTERVLSNLGLQYDAGSTSNVINNYIERVKELNAWKDSLNILKGLKEKLSEEVEVEDDEK